MKYLTWLWGPGLVTAAVAIAGMFGLKALHDHGQATALDAQTRGGIVGLLGGLTFALIGTRTAKKKSSGWRKKWISAAKNKRG